MNWQQEQEQFWQWINQPRDLADDADAIAQMLAPHSHLSQAEALAIYNNAYHQRMVDLSSQLFPILFHTLGSELYTRMWIGYMGSFPPRVGPISQIGEQLSTYLSQHEHFGKLPAAADIAQLENLLITLFDTIDEPAYSLEQLRALPQDAWPTMVWLPRQDWALMYSIFDLEQYWQQMKPYIEAGGTPGEAPFAIKLLAPTPNADIPNLLVHRRNHTMHFMTITPALGIMLSAVQSGENFASICERLASHFPDQDIAALGLKTLLASIELELLTCPQ